MQLWKQEDVRDAITILTSVWLLQHLILSAKQVKKKTQEPQATNNSYMTELL